MTDIASFRPDEATAKDLADYYEMVVAAHNIDRPTEPPPSFETAVGGLHTPLVGSERSQCWVARYDGQLVALARIGFPGSENSHLAFTSIVVSPKMRRAGIGTELLRAALSAILAEGRTTVATAGVIEGSIAADWALRLGYQVVGRNVSQRLDLAETDQTRWQVAPPQGYRLAQWTRRTPPELLASYARARTAIHDMPNAGLGLLLPEWTPERVRQAEKEQQESGIQECVVVAIDDTTQQVVGLTILELHRHRPGLAIQEDTAVLAEHRGRGLGRCIKAANLRWLVANHPAVAQIGTSTAASNVHMIRVNHQIGFMTVRSTIRATHNTRDLASILKVL